MEPLEFYNFAEMIGVLISSDESLRLQNGEKPRKFKLESWGENEHVYAGSDGQYNDDGSISCALIMKRENEFLFPWSPSQLEIFSTWFEVEEKNKSSERPKERPAGFNGRFA